MASRKEIDVFLESAQYRAFRHAHLSVPDRQQALALVRTAMLKLTQCHPHASAAELPLLFHRILLTTIRRQLRHDWQRDFMPRLRRSLIPPHEENTEPSPLETLELAPHLPAEAPEIWLSRPDMVLFTDAALRFLPLAQREAFLLCQWEYLSVRDAARILSTSERRIRREANRAQQTLEAIFAQKGIRLNHADDADAAITPPSIGACIVQTLKNDAPFLDDAVRLALQDARAVATLTLQRQLAQPAQRLEQFRRYVMMHTLGVRRAILLLAMGLLAAGLIARAPHAPADSGRVDAELLAGDVPLDTLLDPHLKEIADAQ